MNRVELRGGNEMNLQGDPWKAGSGGAAVPADDVIAAARAQADFYAEMVGPDAYEHTVPNLSGFISKDAGLKRYMLSILGNPSVKTPPEDVYLLRDAFVCALPLLYKRDRDFFAHSGRDHHTVYPVEFFAELGGGTIPVLDAQAIFIFKAGTANYGHILVEMLPRLENVAPLIGEPTRLLVPPLPGTMTDQLQGIVDRMYPNKFVIEPMRTPIMQVREVIYAGPVSLHNKRKSRTLLRFAERLREIAPRAGSPERIPARIYVSREGTTNRRMLNEAEIRATFEARGYTSVQPERLTLLEQVAMFANATDIAGPIGAGLTNSIFAPKSAHVLILDSGMQDFFFWDLACLRGQSFTWHFGKPLAPFDIACLHTDYHMPVEPVRALLETLE